MARDREEFLPYFARATGLLKHKLSFFPIRTGGITPSPPLTDFRFPATPTPVRAPLHTARLAVRWGDMDALGHVNNAAYFVYFEQARVEALGALGVTLGPESVLVVAATAAVYTRPVTDPATVEVAVEVGPPGGSSFPTYYTLTVDGVVCATGEATVVQVDGATGRATRLPTPLREALEARLAAAATAAG